MSKDRENAASNPPTRRVGVIVLGLIFMTTSGALGALLGGVYVRFLMPKAPDGWTGIAQALGGLMTGGLIAIVIAAFVVAPLARRGTRALALGAAITAGAAFLIAIAIYLARPQRPTQGAVGDGYVTPPHPLERITCV